MKDHCTLASNCRAGACAAPEPGKAVASSSPAGSTQRRFCLFVGLLVTAVTALAAERPNLLFILTEDQGAHLSFLGTPGLRTPHMDAVARSGVYFKNAFVAYPVCSASKAAIYTGLHNHTNGILNNTLNYYKPAAQVTSAERNAQLARTNRIHPEVPTWVERLQAAGYYQGVTGKLHVLPNEKFPYDEFFPKGAGAAEIPAFIRRAQQAGKPWHLFLNIMKPHRPFPDSDREKIRVRPAEVKLPAFLPNTPKIRQDWAEYLAAIEMADQQVGAAMAALRDSGQADRTIVVFMGGDHGPAFPHGKMTLYDLGLRVTLTIAGPGIARGVISENLVSAVDLAPTLLDLLGLEPLPASHGVTLRPVLAGNAAAKTRDYVFAQISNRGPLPNDGMQERSVTDGRWHLIYREKLTPAWRTVQDDSKSWKAWRNRSYDEIVKHKAKFPEAYRILAEMDPQSLGGKTRALELYDLNNDPDEMRDLANDPAHQAEVTRLMGALRAWARTTHDRATALSAQ
jgi:N-sulfoglucosamine sulfohydrolase